MITTRRTADVLTAALVQGHFEDLREVLSPTVTMSVALHDEPFHGPEAVLLILPLVGQALPDLRVEAPPMVDGERACVFLTAPVSPDVPALHLAVAVEAAAGLVTRIDVHARPLESLQAFEALMGRLHFGAATESESEGPS